MDTQLDLERKGGIVSYTIIFYSAVLSFLAYAELCGVLFWRTAGGYHVFYTGYLCITIVLSAVAGAFPKLL